MQACGTDMLQVGSSDSPLEKLDKSRMVPDLRELCDMLHAHGFRCAYENWCWSTHAPDWKDVWGIVKEVDRDNIGLCLDTFQTAGGEWADPRTSSGLLEDVGKEELERRFNESLDELARTIPMRIKSRSLSTPREMSRACFPEGAGVTISDRCRTMADIFLSPTSRKRC
jgi:hypothetical protein